jgi:hypothetical protein
MSKDTVKATAQEELEKLMQKSVSRVDPKLMQKSVSRVDPEQLTQLRQEHETVSGADAQS